MVILYSIDIIDDVLIAKMWLKVICQIITIWRIVHKA